MWVKPLIKLPGLTIWEVAEVDDAEGEMLVATGRALDVNSWEARLAAEGYADEAGA